jgi:hypothetical protein
MSQNFIQLIDPYEPCMFTAYRKSDSDSHPEYYQTIAHWIESEKFRGSNEELREEVIHMPTGKEAAKLAGRNSDQIRKHWKSVKSRVIKCGMFMALDQNPDLVARVKPLAALTSLEVGMEFDPDKRIGFYNLANYVGLLWEAADAIINRPNRLTLVVGHKGESRSKMNALEKSVDLVHVTQLLIPIVKGTSTAAEDFALEKYIPVKFSRAPKGKIDADFIVQLVHQTSSLLVVENKGGKSFDALIMQAKTLAKPMKLVVA